MKISIFLFVLIIVNEYLPNSILKGTYEGVWANKKIVISFKTNDKLLYGEIYESRNKYHKLMGDVFGDSLRGVIKFNTIMDIPFKGIIKEKGKKVEIDLYFPTPDTISHKPMTISLTKVYNSTEINFDKFFPKRKVVAKEHDAVLINKWLLIKDINAEGKDITTKRNEGFSMTLHDNGTVNMFIPEYANTKAMALLKVKWYTSEKVLYTEFADPINRGTEVSEVKYEIRGDTLITQSASGFKQIYLKQ